jgi:hypothetical protein
LIGIDQTENFYYTAVWALSLAGPSTWSYLAQGTSPPPRSEPTAVYDPVRDRIVLFGGSWNAVTHNDAWELSLSGNPAWSQLVPTGSPPPPMDGHCAIYDPVRDRMVVSGTGSNVWALSLGGNPVWTMLSPAGARPSGRRGHSAIYDPMRDRMVIFGGRDPYYRNDVWALTWSEPPVSTLLSLVGAEVQPERVLLTWHGPDAAGLAATLERRTVEGDWCNRATITGDATGHFRYEDRDVLPGTRYAYRLAYRLDGELVRTAAHWVTVPTLVFGLHALEPNPARGAFVVSATVLAGEPARLEVFDVAGRMILTRVVNGPGVQRVELEESRDLPPGIYSVRLTQAGRSSVARGVLLR